MVPASLVPLLPLLYAAIILLATWLVAHLASTLVRRAMRRSVPQVATGLGRAVAVAVWVAGAVFAVSELGVSTDILLLLVGLAGVAVLLGLRGALENLGAKYLSDVYVPFKVGDTVEVHGQSGKVIEINPMSTVLLSERDRLVSVPNAYFLREAVVNTTPEAWKEVVIPFTIGPAVDLPSLESEVRRTVGKMRSRLDARYPPLLSIKSRTSQSTGLVLTLMLRYPEDRDAIMTEATQRLSDTLRHYGGGQILPGATQAA